jgi:hypothetical protein
VGITAGGGLPLGADGRLAPGRHVTDWRTVRDVFVANAPHSAHRATIYRALQAWLNSMRVLLPSGGVAWMNGGFITHKPEPPKDADVVLMVQLADLNALSPADGLLLSSQLTNRSAGTQPMGGLVDAFIAERGDPQGERIWDGFWSAVKAADGSILAGESKGYLEVPW